MSKIFIIFSLVASVPAFAVDCQTRGLKSLLEIFLELNQNSKDKNLLAQSQTTYFKLIQETQNAILQNLDSQDLVQQKVQKLKQFIQSADLDIKLYEHSQRNHLEKGYLGKSLETLKQTESILLSQAQLKPVEDIRHYNNSENRGVGFILDLNPNKISQRVRIEFHKDSWNLAVLSDTNDPLNGVTLSFEVSPKHFRRLQKWNALERNLIDQVQAIHVQKSTLNRSLRATPGFSNGDKKAKLLNLESVEKYLGSEIQKVRESAAGDRIVAFRNLVNFAELVLQKAVSGSLVEQYSYETRDQHRRVVSYLTENNLFENDLDQSQIREFSILIDELAVLVGFDIRQSYPKLAEGLSFSSLRFNR